MADHRDSTALAGSVDLASDVAVCSFITTTRGPAPRVGDFPLPSKFDGVCCARVVSCSSGDRCVPGEPRPAQPLGHDTPPEGATRHTSPHALATRHTSRHTS